MTDLSIARGRARTHGLRRASRLVAVTAALGLGTLAAACGTDADDASNAAPAVVTEIVTASPGSGQQTQPETSTVVEQPAPQTADLGTYRMENGVFFSSASGKWRCGIRPGSVGCHGPMPSSAPRSYGRHPTGVTIRNGVVEAVRFSSPEYLLQSGETAPVLPYGQTVTSHGFSCTIDETAGVTCTDTGSGHGFTVSDAAYRAF